MNQRHVPLILVAIVHKVTIDVAFPLESNVMSLAYFFVLSFFEYRGSFHITSLNNRTKHQHDKKHTYIPTIENNPNLSTLLTSHTHTTMQFPLHFILQSRCNQPCDYTIQHYKHSEENGQCNRIRFGISVVYRYCEGEVYSDSFDCYHGEDDGPCDMG